MTSAPVAATLRSQWGSRLRVILTDPLYRNSLILIANTAATSAIGFAFWTLAARYYPAATVGVFASLTSGVGLLAAVAALGLSNTMIRHVAGAAQPRELVVVAVTAITTVGTALCFGTVLLLGPVLPPALHLGQHGRMAVLLTVLVVLTAVSSTLDACLIALRSSPTVLVKNLAGSLAKLAALILLSAFPSAGLLLSYGIGLVLATILSGLALSRKLGGRRPSLRSFRALPRYLSMTSGNYLATVMGIVPSSIVPFEVLVIRGAAETARFAVAFLIAGFLNFIPSTIAQVLFAEASRQGVAIGGQLRKAIRGIYALVVPAVCVVVAAAPLLLGLFGGTYLSAASCLRILACSTLLTGGTYLVDSLLIARDRIRAYIVMNGVNAALVVAAVALLLPRGLAAGAAGWAIAQGLSLVVGMTVVATGALGRHHSAVPGPPRPVAAGSRAGWPHEGAAASAERQLREVLLAWPLMPAAMIAETIGWEQPIPVLGERVAWLRAACPHPYQQAGVSGLAADGSAVFGLWFPPAEVPVGRGQTRSARQLPVLTMVNCNSRWLSAILLPSGQPPDLCAGLWELFLLLGAVPVSLAGMGEAGPSGGGSQAGVTHAAVGGFLRGLGTGVRTGQASPGARELLERMHVSLENSFLAGRAFASPADFNRQLRDWLDEVNTGPCRPPDWPPAELLSRDIGAMRPLPGAPPPTGWRLDLRIPGSPFFPFDANYYAIDPSATGQPVELIATLTRIRVFCHGRLVADHPRSWGRGQTVPHSSYAGPGGLRAG
jgi:O-antigen/teichoic acid export membrane protein